MNRSKVPSLLLLPVTLSLFVLAGPSATPVRPTNPVPVTEYRLVKAAMQAADKKASPVEQQQLTRTALEKGWPLIIPSKKGS